MKKKFFAIILLAVALLFTFSGCSCEGATILSFSNAFNDKTAPLASYYEKCEYDVTYEEKNEFYAKASSLNNKNLKFSYDVGKYVTEFKVEAGLPQISSSGKPITSDIRDLLEGKTVYHYKTSFSINIKYSINGGEEKTHTDTINTEVYFGNADLSFAPIFSDTQFETSLLLFSAPDVQTFKSDYQTVYNQNFYTLSGSSTLSDSKQNDVTEHNRTENYTFRSLIDNAQFMFAIRNLTIETGKSGYFLAATLSYNQPKSIAVSNATTYDSDVDFTYNGTSINSITTTSYNYALSESKSSGIPQYFFLQAKSTESLPNKSLLVKYIEPVIEYSSLNCAGSLNYKLKTVTIS